MKKGKNKVLRKMLAFYIFVCAFVWALIIGGKIIGSIEWPWLAVGIICVVFPWIVLGAALVVGLSLYLIEKLKRWHRQRKVDARIIRQAKAAGVSGVGDDKMIIPFFREIGRAIQRHLKQMGHAYVCHDWQTSATIKEAFGELTPKNLIVWRKAEAGGLGSFYTKIYELIWLFANEPEKGIIGKNKVPARTINGVANIWDCPVVQAPERDHNAQKPVNLIKIAIENSSDPDEKVLDPFGGSGSTMIACEELYRSCYLMEMEPKYCDVIVKRYIKTTGKSSGIQLIRKGESMGREYFERMFSE